MKKIISDFIVRGLIASGFGPLTLAVIYWCIKATDGLQAVSVDEMCLGIVTVSALAFTVGAAGGIFRIERLPLGGAILIHGAVLYAGYLAVYLVNGWLLRGRKDVFFFSLIFFSLYAVIWVLIYLVTRFKTARLNALLERSRENEP